MSAAKSPIFSGKAAPEDVRSSVAEVRRKLECTSGEPRIDVQCLSRQLDDAGATLRQSLSDGDQVGDELAEGVELAFDIAALQGELQSRDLADRLDVIARIKQSMGQLAKCSTPQELIEAVPGELCWACGFTRALVSRIRGSSWVPEVYDAVPGGDPQEDVFRTWVEDVEIPLDHMLLETELVRRRMPALVDNAGINPRVFKDIVVRGRTNSYVVAPIIPAGRAIGFLHADRYGQAHEVTAEDRDSIWTFAEQFAAVYHRTVLAERLASQRAQLRDAFAEAERQFDELRDAEIELGNDNPDPELEPVALFRPAESRLEGLLTRREREVLELITSGATNVKIAEQLVLSEGTVKSHVKHILRKLRVANRAEAVARYLQLMRLDQQQQVSR